MTNNIYNYKGLDQSVVAAIVSYRAGRHSQREKQPWDDLLSLPISNIGEIPAKDFASRMNSLIGHCGDIWPQILELTRDFPEDASKTERYYAVYHQLQARPSCKHCGKTLKPKARFRMVGTREDKSDEGYGNFCNRSCAASYEGTVNKRKATNVERHGVEVPVQSADIREKMQATMIERHGVAFAAQSPLMQAKRAEDNLAKHGINSPSPFAVAVTQKKVKETISARYNCENPMGNAVLAHKAGDGKRRHAYSQLTNVDRVGNVTPLFTEDEYKGVRDLDNKYLPFQYPWECLDCGTQFQDGLECDSNTGVNKPRCPKCYPKKKSYGEHVILQIVKDAVPEGIEVLEGDRNLLNGFEVDILVPDLKLAIEYNGIYWHSEYAGGKGMEYHQNKLERLKELGYRLIYVWEDELYKLETTISRTIEEACGAGHRIDASKCSYKTLVGSDDAVDYYHREGTLGSRVTNHVLTQGGQPVCIMQLSHRPSKKKGQAGKSVLRYTALNGYNVKEGFTTLFNHATKLTKGDRVYQAELDPSFDDTAMYEAVGFELVEEKKEQQWYLMKPYQFSRRLSRVEFTERAKLIDDTLRNDTWLTETRLAKLGADRVWGVKRQVWQLEVKK